MIYQSTRYGPRMGSKPVLQFGMKKNYFMPYSLSGGSLSGDGIFDTITSPSEEMTWYAKVGLTALAVFFGQYFLSKL